MYIEYNLTDKCNLNCKACAAFSPLVDKDNSKPLSKVKEDFKKIYELSEDGKRVIRITIMGGEPLLYKDLDRVIQYLAELFRDSEICIVTNGSLISKKEDEFFETLKKYVTTLFISKYPTAINYEEIEILLNKWKIPYKYYGGEEGKNLFYYQYLNNEYNEDYRNTVCLYRTLFILKDNKVYSCTEIAYFDYFDKAFKGKHNLKVTEEDYIDLNKINSYKELMEAKKKIPPFCGYCDGTSGKKLTEWEKSKKSINEWLKF